MLLNTSLKIPLKTSAVDNVFLSFAVIHFYPLVNIRKPESGPESGLILGLEEGKFG